MAKRCGFKSRNTGKKAQMEIMGLAIIVVLLTLAMLFVVQFILLRQPADLKKTFTHKELAANTVNTLLSTTTACNGLSITQLLEDCLENGGIVCNGLPSCSYADNEIKTIFSRTLDKWNKEYYFTAIASDQSILGPYGKACTGEKTSSSAFGCCIIPTGAGSLNVNLDICG